MAFNIEYIYKIIDQFSPSAEKIKLATKNLNADIEKQSVKLKQFGNTLKRIGTGLTIAGIAGIGFGIKSIITEASKMEDVTAAFTPLMGSVENAKNLVAALNKEAATTPFQFENIASTAKQLLPLMNGDINRTTELFRMLGDTAGGNTQKLDSITRGFTKALGKGKADMEALNMITEAGVPILDQLSKKYGLSINEIYKMSAAGKISADMLTDTFKTMTSEGGIFYQGMEIASKTFSGRISTLQDTIKITLAKIGESMLPIAKDIVEGLITTAEKIGAWVENNQAKIQNIVNTTINVFKFLGGAIMFVAKVGVFLFNVFKFFAPLIMGIVAAFTAYNIITLALAGKLLILNNITKLVAATQQIFNLIMTANPIGLIILAIGVLVGLLVLLAMNFDKVKAAIQGAFQSNFAQNIIKQFKKIIDNPIIKAVTTIMMYPFVTVISVIKEIKDRWDYVVDAFTTGGIIGAIKAIGKAILSGMLKPIEAILEVAAKFDPFGLAQKGLEKIQAFREGMFADEQAQKIEADKIRAEREKEKALSNIKDIGNEKQKLLDKEFENAQNMIFEIDTGTDDVSKAVDKIKILKSDIKASAITYIAKQSYESGYANMPAAESPKKQVTNNKFTAETFLNIFKEKDINIVPFKKSANLGLNMQEH